jgi:hypothetical protein
MERRMTSLNVLTSTVSSEVNQVDSIIDQGEEWLVWLAMLWGKTNGRGRADPEVKKEQRYTS